MPKTELLSPVGNKEMLYQAIHNGADAVYLSGKNFGARKFALNFTNEELTEAIKYSHLYGVKVYVTINTIIFEEEVETFIDYVRFLHQNNVDAVIMQDIGMINLVLEKFPNLEVHASVQMHNHNKEGVEYLKSIGVKRVILARELTINEIRNIDVDIEKEVFIHGALCICYSGCCLFSSLVGSRSGNRGECAGSCRLPYKLLDENYKELTDNKYLLSTKELNTSYKLNELLDSNIASLKIEGRMKSPEYVGIITKFYRNIIDNYYKTNKIIINEEDIKNIKKIYNRDFTLGHAFSSKNKDLMNIDTPNHIGIPLGKIIGFYKNKIKIKLTENLHQEDGIRFSIDKEGLIVNHLYNDKLLLVNEAKAGSIIYLDNKFNIDTPQTILKTTDVMLITSLQKYNLKKIEITCYIKALINNDLEITFDDGINKVTIFGTKVSKALTAPITEERIIEQLNKLGNTPFTITNFINNIDKDIFISVKELNEIKRSLTDKLITLRENSQLEIKELDTSFSTLNNYEDKIKLNALVRTEEQLQTSIASKINDIYVTDYNLYKEYKKAYPNIYYQTDRVHLDKFDLKNENILVTELGSLNKNKNNNSIVSDYYLNVVNSYTMHYLNKLGVKRITLSVEIADDKVSKMINSYKEKFNNKLNLEMLVYGRVELMIMKYCPVSMILSKNTTCTLCREHKQYYLKDRFDKIYPLYQKNCITHIMHHKILEKTNIKELIELGINNFRLEFFDEDSNKVKNTINKYLELIKTSKS